MLFKTKIHLFPSGRLGNQLYFGAMALAVQRELNSCGRKYKTVVHSDSDLTGAVFLLGLKIDKQIRKPLFRFFLGEKRLHDSNILLRFIHKIGIIRYQVLCHKLTGYEDCSTVRFKSRITLSESRHDYRFFEHSKDQIRNYHEQSGLNDLTTKYFSKAQLSDRIAVHMRFGDYLQPKIAIQYGNLGKNYYSRAFSILSNGSNIETLKIQLFSDDLKKGVALLKELGLKDISTMEKLKLPPEQELLLMSNFSQLIISNSTFSWWAGYFAPESARIVAPNPLMKSADSHFSRSPNWIYVDGWS